MALTGLKNTCILLIFFCVFLLLILLYLDKVATDSSHFVAKFHCNAIVSCGEIANKLIEDCLVIFNQNNPCITRHYLARKHCYGFNLSVCKAH